MIKTIIIGSVYLLIFSILNSCGNTEPIIEFKNASGLTGIFESDSSGLEFRVLDNEEITYLLKSSPSIGIDRFKSLKKSDYCPSNEICVDFIFDKKGTEMYIKLTKENINQQIFMIIDGVVISAPQVMSQLTLGRGQFPIKEQFFDSLFVTK